jgi:DNA repair protein RadC
MSQKESHLRISDLREENRPRERLISEGAQALSDGELLAVLLGSGMSGKNAIDLGNQILKELGGFTGIHKADIANIQEIPGVGLAKAARIKAAVELGNRLAKDNPEEQLIIRSPEDVAKLVWADRQRQTVLCAPVAGTGEDHLPRVGANRLPDLGQP